MNEAVVIKENDIVDEARVGEIVIEINAIRRQTMTQMLYASVEIGRLLCEAKEKMPHGSFGVWLSDNFSYSQSTANNLMKLYRNYGEPDQLDMFFAEGERIELFGNLTPSQAIALLGIPEPERKEFVQTHDMDKMSVRDIEAEVKARKEAEKRVEELEYDLSAKNTEKLAAQAMVEALKKEYEKKVGELEKDLETARSEASQIDAKAEAERIKEEKKKLKDKMEKELEKKVADAKAELEAKLTQEQKKNGELSEQLTSLVQKTKETLKEEYGKQISSLEERAKQAEEKLERAGNSLVQKFAVIFEQFQTDFKSLCSIIAQMKNEGDADSAEKLSAALGKIVSSMKDQL